jgi:ABC-type nitrate/sulfonate/bicarbonate transport system substrate-binding protein
MSVVSLPIARGVKGHVTELWYTRCPVPTASGVALEQKWLQAELAQLGITLSSVRASNDRGTRTSHYDHSLKGMFREGGNIPAIWARARGRNTAVVGLTWVPEQQLILARPDGKIREVADLRGKRLGLPQHGGHVVDHRWSMSLHGFLSALSLAGLGPQDVQFVDIKTPQTDLREKADGTLGDRATLGRPENAAVETLLRGDVDAIYAKGVSASQVLGRSLHRVVDLSTIDNPEVQINNGTPRPITVDRALVEERPDLVSRYLAVLLRTAEWAETHPDEVVRIVGGETGGDDAAVRGAYGPQLHRRLRPSLAKELIERLKIQKDFLRAWKVLPADFSVDDWIAPGPLAEAETIVAQTPSAVASQL